jgi:type II secretory pathway pseudopilin PulG
MFIKLRARKGYTLIEAAVVFLLVAILSFGIGSFMVSSTRLWLFITGRQSVIKTSRSSLNRMVAEMRKIKSKTSILKITTSEVQFITFDSAASIDYNKTGSNLMRASGTSNDILAEGLNSLAFTYLNSLEAVTAVSTEVRSIRISLSVSGSGQTVTQETSVRMRGYEIH